MSRKLWKMAESKFMNLCDTVGITATKPEVDENGWDYFLEFPNITDNSQPLDSQPTPISCKVQIKSTDIINKNQLPIKLSTILRLVKTPMPTFICFMHFDNFNEVQNIFLVHIDKEIISKVLEKVRKCEHQQKKINNSKITIQYNKSHKIDTISGLDLKKQIEKFIPNSMSDYINNKNKILESVGFDDKAIALTMKFPTSITDDDLINMSMGLKKSVPIIISDITQTRFNIKLPHNIPDFVNSSDIKLSVNNISNSKVNMIIKKTEYSPILFECDFDVYIDTLQIIANKKMILKNNFLTMYIDFEKENHRFELCNFENEDCRKLEEWQRIFKFANLATNENKVYYMETKKDNVILNRNKELQLNLNNTDWIVMIHNIFNKLSNIYRIMGLSNNENIIFKEILNNYDQINSIHDLISSELKDMNINFTAYSDQNNNFTKCTLIFPVNIIMNNQYIGMVVMLLGSVILDNNSYSFNIKKRIFSESFIVDIKNFDNSYFQKVIDDMDIPINIQPSFIIQKYIKKL